MTLGLILLGGALLGWFASMALASDSSQEQAFFFAIGPLAGLLAGVVMAPLLGGPALTAPNTNVLLCIAGFIGSVTAIAIANVVQRGPAQ